MIEMPPCCGQNGRVENACARTVYAQRVDGLIRLSGVWRGWRVQGDTLIGPGGIRWTPATLRHAERWQKAGFAGGDPVSLPGPG